MSVRSSPWQRQGVLLAPDGRHAWWRSAAGIPTCLPLHERLWRIWFGGRDAEGRAGVLCADVDPLDGMRVLAIRDVPGLQRGPAGSFDSAGLWASAALCVDGRILLWYTGMRLGEHVPHELAIGLACSDDGGLTFRKCGDGPVLVASADGASFATTPCVLRVGDAFRMWFSRGREWRKVNDRLEPFYDLHCATSADGLAWTVDETPVLDLRDTPWSGLTRPWIEQHAGESTLWFSARGSSSFREASPDAYRLYSAALRSGRAEAIAPVALHPVPRAEDWDAWMQVACCVVRQGTQRVMFYNGNDFSRTGLGWATQECPGEPS